MLQFPGTSQGLLFHCLRFEMRKLRLRNGKMLRQKWDLNLLVSLLKPVLGRESSQDAAAAGSARVLSFCEVLGLSRCDCNPRAWRGAGPSPVVCGTARKTPAGRRGPGCLSLGCFGRRELRTLCSPGARESDRQRAEKGLHVGTVCQQRAPCYTDARRLGAASAAAGSMLFLPGTMSRQSWFTVKVCGRKYRTENALLPTGESLGW